MGEATAILRSSLNAFLRRYHSFASIAALLIFPFSTSVLLSQALITSSSSSSTLLTIISSRLRSLFEAAGFPVSSHLFSLLNLMLSQTIFSSLFTLPFSLTFLSLAKASVIEISCQSPFRHRLVPPLHLYYPILLTHIFNSFIVLSANAAVFSLLFLVFNAAELLGLSSGGSILALSSAGAVIYSLVLGNTIVTCNLAIVVSAMENSGGHISVLKACVLIRGRVSTALSLALPINLAMAAVEVLFQYRVMRPYHLSTKFNPSLIWEGFTIAYIYSILIVLDIITSCLFFKSCNSGCGRANWVDWGGCQREMEPEEKAALKV